MTPSILSNETPMGFLPVDVGNGSAEAAEASAACSRRFSKRLRFRPRAWIETTRRM
jgi:hypothetical protein